MLVYEKDAGENRHLYGTLNNIPSESDNQLVYEDADGDAISPTLSGTYVDDGHGGILMKGEDGDTFVGVYIKKADNSLVNIIPGGDYEPETKTLKSIKFKKKPTKTTYIAGDTLDLTGAVVEATFETGEKETLALDADGLTFSPANGDTLATTDTAVTATYVFSDITKTATCAITVTEE